MKGNFTKAIFRLIFPGMFLLFLGTNFSWSQTNICAGDSISLKLTGYSGTFQWQKSTDTKAWTDIPNATSQTMSCTD